MSNRRRPGPSTSSKETDSLMELRSTTVIALALWGVLSPSSAWGEPGAPGSEEPTAAMNPTAEAPPERVSWETLVDEVERTSPLMSAARAGLDSFEAKMKRAQWATFPTFKLEGGAAPSPTIDGAGFSVDVDWESWGYFYRDLL